MPVQVVLLFATGIGLLMTVGGIWWHRAALAPRGTPLRAGAPAQLTISTILILLGIPLAVGSFIVGVLLM